MVGCGISVVWGVVWWGVALVWGGVGCGISVGCGGVWWGVALVWCGVWCGGVWH